MANKSPGIVERHARSCRSRTSGSCNCTPSFQAWVYDRRAPVKDRSGNVVGYGTKIRRTFSGRGALTTAKRWRADASGQVNRGALRATTARQTLREAGDAFLGAAARGEVLSRYRRPYKPSVLRGYRSDLEMYVYPAFGVRKLDDLSPDDFQALVERLIGRGLSGSRVRNVIVPVQALYRRHRRQILFDPTNGLDLPAPGGRRERVATPIEAMLLLAPLEEDDQPIWATAFYAGLRLGELRALRASAIDLERRVISVEHGWDMVEGEIDPKSIAGVRNVPISETLYGYLAPHLERTGRRGSDLAFGRTPATPFAPSTLAKRADRCWAAAAVGAFLRRRPFPVELQRITLHECRHSYSTFLDAAGVSEARADRYMGHSNPSVAARYRHLLPGQYAEDAARLDAYLAGAVDGKVVQFPTGSQTGSQRAESRIASGF